MKTTRRYEYTIKDHLGNARISFTDLNANGVVNVTNVPATNEVLQENHYYSFGLNTEGPWMNDAALDNKYQYNGKEWNDDFGLNLNDYGARWYDAAVGRWNVIDPSLEIYLGFSPYNYALNSPILYIDPNGEYVDVSDILRKRKGKYVNKEQAEAFLLFAKSDVGKEFLSKFAAKGQEIAGHKYTKSGVFDKQGFDLSFSARNINYGASDGESRLAYGPNGQTEVQEKDGGLQLNIVLNSEKNIANDFSKAFFENPNDGKARLQYVLASMETLFHESSRHAGPFAQDKADDCKINCSNFDNHYGLDLINDPGKRNRNKVHHLSAKESGSDFNTKVIPAILHIYNQNNSGLSKNQIIKHAKKFDD